LVDLERKLEDAQKELISFIEKEKMTNFGEGKESSLPDAKIQDEASALLQRLHNQRVELDLQLSQLLKRYRSAHPKVEQLKQELATVDEKIADEDKRFRKLQDTRRDGDHVGQEEGDPLLDPDPEGRHQQADVRHADPEAQRDGHRQRVIRNNVDVLEYAKLPGGPAGPDKRGRFCSAWPSDWCSRSAWPFCWNSPTSRSARPKKCSTF